MFSDTPFIVNVKVLAEGFNAPATKGVCFLHMCSSERKIIQIIGRELRPHENKIIAHVILPFINDSESKYINNFLKIIANNDENVKNAFQSKKIGGYINIMPANENYKPIKVTPENDFIIWGIVTHVIKSL